MSSPDTTPDFPPPPDPAVAAAARDLPAVLQDMPSETGYPMFLTGAGVKKGFTCGATDEYGIKAVEGRMHTNDLHATLLALMGPDHERLSYRYAGRDFRLTDVTGNAVTDILA